MLSKDSLNYIESKTKSYVSDWLNEEANINFDSKEIGHKHGEEVESYVVSRFISEDIRFSEPEGSREFGDLYFNNNGVKEFINIKFGFQKKGQPNMGAGNRFIDYLHNDKIDSYWVLSINLLDDSKNFQVHIFDIYKNLELIHYDNGTGQFMLKENIFYGGTYKVNESILEKKVIMMKLKTIYDKGVDSLIERRIKQKKSKEILFSCYEN